MRAEGRNSSVGDALKNKNPDACRAAANRE